MHMRTALGDRSAHCWDQSKTCHRNDISTRYLSIVHRQNNINDDKMWYPEQFKQAVQEATTICPAPCKLSFDLESGVWVTCDVGYLCANFSLPRPLCSRLRPDVRDRQTSDVRRASSLNAPYPRDRGITINSRVYVLWYTNLWTQLIFYFHYIRF